MPLRNSKVKSNAVRFRVPEVGEAIAVERYGAGQVKAVILNPIDFEELRAGSEMIEELTGAPELSELAARVHHTAESPEGELIDSEASVRALLGV